MLPPAAVPHAPLGLCMCISGVLMALDVTQEDIICAPPCQCCLSELLYGCALFRNTMNSSSLWQLLQSKLFCLRLS